MMASKTIELMAPTTLKQKCEEFRGNLDILWQEKKYCDITFIADDGKTRISAHRLVIEAAIPFFADRISEGIHEYIVNEIDGTSLQSFINLCYTGSLDVNEKNIISLYAGAVHFEFNALSTALDNHVMGQLNNLNCLHFYAVAKTFRRLMLFERTEKYICENFVELIDGSAFYELDVIYLKRLLSLEELKTPSPEYLFCKIINWIKYERNGKRINALADFIPYLNLQSISLDFLRENIMPLCETVETKNLVIEALEQHLAVTPCQSPSEIIYERLLVVSSIVSKRLEILEYSFERQKWKALSLFATELCFLSVVHSVALNSLCVVGGHLHTTQVHNVLLWNLTDHQFTNLAGMIEPRSSVGVTVLNDGSDADGDLIVVGGNRDKRTLATVERWSRKSGKWRSLKSLKENRVGHRLITVGNIIYCIGGLDNNKDWMKTFECYNLTENRWTTLAPLNNARGFCAVLNEDGKLYVIGGLSNVVECYDIAQNKWIELCTVAGSEDIRTCVRNNNRLVALGTKIVLISNGDWKMWYRTGNIKALDKYIYSAFSIPLE